MNIAKKYIYVVFIAIGMNDENLSTRLIEYT